MSGTSPVLRRACLRRWLWLGRPRQSYVDTYRSLLNTAKLMDSNPTLLRLKELEMLEKVTEKIDQITVCGGLDGVLNELVKIGGRP